MKCYVLSGSSDFITVFQYLFQINKKTYLLVTMKKAAEKEVFCSLSEKREIENFEKYQETRFKRKLKNFILAGLTHTSSEVRKHSTYLSQYIKS